ncbi:unnamed protein product, partial [Dibothriocephalus latus]
MGSSLGLRVPLWSRISETVTKSTPKGNRCNLIVSPELGRFVQVVLLSRSLYLTPTEVWIVLSVGAECQSSKEEVKEVLQALEELAMNYDQRAQELEVRDRELEEVQEQMSKKLTLMNNKESELQQARDSLNNERKKYTDVVTSLLRDIVDV